MKPIVTKEPLHERWGDYSVKEIDKIHATKCANCPYHGKLGVETCCDYMLITGEARGVFPDLCTHNTDAVERASVYTPYGYVKKMSFVF